MLFRSLGRIASKAARRAANDIYKGIGNNIIGPAARLTTQLGTVGGLTFGAYEGYEWWKELKAPKALSAADQAEFTWLLADYNKMVPDLATFNALPPDVQKKLIDIANRLKQAEQQPQGN